MSPNFDITRASEVYRHKFVDVPQILADWYQPFGGIAGRRVLEFGCGEGTMALGLALQHNPAQVVGVEVLDVFNKCRPFAQRNLGLAQLPDHLQFQQIRPGQGVADFGLFDFIYSWSVFEHVAQDLLSDALSSVARVLKPTGVFFLQISPLYYSAFGSHLAPWIAEPWAHLGMQDEAFEQAFFGAPEASEEIMESWSVYLPAGATPAEARQSIWRTYQTLNKVTIPQLARLVDRAGLKIVRDYRTTAEQPVPESLADIYEPKVLLTEQVVWLLQLHDTP